MSKNAAIYDYMVGTPIIGNTPAYNYGGQSEYQSTMGTPNYQGSFSPGPNNYYSPVYGSQQSPNPYMSPVS